MPIAEFDDEDDEDWYDDQSDLDDASVPCPDCGEPVPELLGKCPMCGYWLTSEDRVVAACQAKPFWIKLTALVVLMTILASVLLAIW